MDTEEGLGDMGGVGQVLGRNIEFSFRPIKFSWKDMVVRYNWYTDPKTRKKNLELEVWESHHTVKPSAVNKGSWISRRLIRLIEIIQHGKISFEVIKIMFLIMKMFKE